MHPAETCKSVIMSLIEQDDDSITFFPPQKHADGTESFSIVVSCGWNGHIAETFDGPTFASVLIAAKTTKERRRVECN